MTDFVVSGKASRDILSGLASGKTKNAKGMIDALVVEDEAELQDAIVTTLQLDGMQAMGLASVEAAQRWLQDNRSRTILLDLTLPGASGLEWLRERRPAGTSGVIIITGNASAQARIEARTLGADDYLQKPLNLEELTLAVRNLIQRLPGVGEWTLDLLNWTLVTPAGEAVPLTASEVGFLQALAREPGIAVDRRDIVAYLGAHESSYDMRRMEVLVRRLRTKLEAQIGEPGPIQTARGVGYSFTAAISITERPPS